jgi:asparagine synthase (glutamine-hydrolysing)
MAVLLLWYSWCNSAPDPAVWDAMQRRAAARSVFAGEIIEGEGWRLFAARTRGLEPHPLLRPSAPLKHLAVDRAYAFAAGGANEFADLNDGTPCAAICIDELRKHVTLYRDILGQRRLVYARVRGGLIVASGEDVLRAHPEVAGDLDADFLAAYLTALPAAHDATVFRSIHCVRAGETLAFEQENVRAHRDRLAPDDSWRTLPDADIVDGYRERLEASVHRACQGAARIGISLSAGLDSSAVAAIASRLPLAATGGVVGVTYGFDRWPQIDERGLVAELAASLGFECRSFAADDLHPLRAELQRPVCPDTPLASPYREFKEAAYREFAAAGVDVWLTGNFGDHLIASSADWLRQGLAAGRWRALAERTGWILRHGGPAGMWHDPGFRGLVRSALRLPANHWSRASILAATYGTRLTERLDEETRDYRDFPRPMQAMLVLGSSSSFDAAGEDWYAQRHGMEIRSPYRDLALSRWCLSIPADLSYRGGASKWLAREAARKLLPAHIVDRPKSSDLTPFAYAAQASEKARYRSLGSVAIERVADLLSEATLSTRTREDSWLLDWRLAALGLWLVCADG